MKRSWKSRLAVLMLAGILLVCSACGKKQQADDGKVRSLETTEDVTAFIEKVYEEVGESNMPMMVEHRELDLEDLDALAFNTGLDSADGVSRVVISESMVGSIPYSMLYITVAEGTKPEDIQKQVMENVDPAKWICVWAEKQVSMTLGDDVFFVMGAEDTVDAVVSAAQQVAEAEFSKIGEAKEQYQAF